jgi:uncharacterized protein YggU (UPF0235/DUF167 family)
MYVKVLVVAGAKKERFFQKTENSFNISVKEPAERNLANKRVLEIVSNHYSVGIRKVKIINGHHHPSKLLSIDLG